MRKCVLEGLAMLLSIMYGCKSRNILTESLDTDCDVSSTKHVVAATVNVRCNMAR
jgi:hypothetical protein